MTAKRLNDELEQNSFWLFEASDALEATSGGATGALKASPHERNMPRGN